MTSIVLKCECGAVIGTAHNITSKSGNRVACCCCDCQAFAKFLENEARTLDEFGGTEIYQTSQSQIKIESGHENLKSLKLTSKGLTRWYTSCCNTPVANTMGASLPFCGIIHSFTDIPDRDKTLGNVRAYCQTQHAIGMPDHPKSHPKFPVGLTLRILRQILQWKIQGKQRPSPFYDEDGYPISEPLILDI